MNKKSILVGVLSLGTLVATSNYGFSEISSNEKLFVEMTCGDKSVDTTTQDKAKEAKCGNKTKKKVKKSKKNKKSLEGKCGEGKCGSGK